MKYLSKLLEIDNSNLAWVLRLGLHGLRTQLQQALKTATVDPGSSVCLELLGELDLLLAESSNPDDCLWSDVLEPTVGELKLISISEEMRTDQGLSNYIGQYEFYSTNDADLWDEIQLLLLRVPEKLANVWQERILTADTYMYSSLPNISRDAELDLSTQAIDPRLMLEIQDGELDLLARVVSTCLKLIEIDSSLHHALKSVDRFSVRSLNDETEKSKYITALIDRFRRVQSSMGDINNITVELRARIDLDEAIHSLVYLPPCDRYSWWGKLQLQARRTLDSVVEKARHAGTSVQIRPLWGTYADVFTWSKDDLQLDIGGVPGEVSACLRVYAKINDEVLPGRVLFRSS